MGFVVVVQGNRYRCTYYCFMGKKKWWDSSIAQGLGAPAVPSWTTLLCGKSRADS